MDEEEQNEERDDDDEIDELFDWMVGVFDSKKPDYTVTIQNGTVSAISDGQQTIEL